MSEKINNGGSAFPRVTYQGTCIPGMSLRDYFAAQVLNGILAGRREGLCDYSKYEVTKDAYLFADEMLKARVMY